MTENNNTNENGNSFTEAPASWNTRYIHPSGFECQITLRSDTGSDLLGKVQNAIDFLLGMLVRLDAAPRAPAPLGTGSRRAVQKDGFDHKRTTLRTFLALSLGGRDRRPAQTSQRHA